MNNLALSFISAILMGLGATLTFDLWGLFLKHAFKITPSNICLIGRWLRYMPAGTFKHSNIGSAPQKSAECVVGWIAHYMIGITFAIVFVVLVGNNWLQHPTLIPAIIFGVVTVLAPFAIMQPGPTGTFEQKVTVRRGKRARPVNGTQGQLMMAIDDLGVGDFNGFFPNKGMEGLP